MSIACKQLNTTSRATKAAQIQGACNVRSVACRASSSRRDLLVSTAGVMALQLLPNKAALAGGLPPVVIKGICDEACTAQLESAELVTLPSGLQYRDIKAGTGPQPKVGYQVTCNYVAMTPNLRIFDSSVDKGAPYDIRVGAGQVIKGLDDGLLSMQVGGIRRFYIPGDMAFPKGLKAAAGRPSVPANTPVVFDVQLLYIPGYDDDE